MKATRPFKLTLKSIGTFLFWALVLHFSLRSIENKYFSTLDRTRVVEKDDGLSSSKQEDSRETGKVKVNAFPTLYSSSVFASDVRKENNIFTTNALSFATSTTKRTSTIATAVIKRAPTAATPTIRSVDEDKNGPNNAVFLASKRQHNNQNTREGILEIVTSATSASSATKKTTILRKIPTPNKNHLPTLATKSTSTPVTKLSALPSPTTTGNKVPSKPLAEDLLHRNGMWQVHYEEQTDLDEEEKNEVAVYSAFYDTRLKNKYVRIHAVIKKVYDLSNKYCYLWFDEHNQQGESVVPFVIFCIFHIFSFFIYFIFVIYI